MRTGCHSTNNTRASLKYLYTSVLVFILLAGVFSISAQTLPAYESVLPSSQQYTVSADAPKLNLTYRTRDDSVERTVHSGDTISGDHVTLTSSWTTSLVNRSRLEVVAPAIPAAITAEDEETTLEIDTRSLGNNATCIINCTAWLTNGSIMSIVFTGVYIGNYFVPHVTVLSPNGGESWTGVNNITWSASDVNSDDVLTFDVLVSADSGSSFTVLASGITQHWLEWDSTGLDKLDTYVVKVRVTDGIYFTSDQSDAPFTAGDVPTSTTTTTSTTNTTTTTTPTAGIEPRVAAFIVILLVSSAAMALIVYHAARKWF
ncbi:MAG: hypothetical protein ACP6KW_03715 [Candidatus Thorarchaeota archaeon]